MAAGKEARAGNRPGTRTSPDLSHPGRDRRKPSKARRSEQRPRGSHLAAPRLALVGWPVPGFSSSSSSLSREGFRGAKNREKLCQGALPLLRPPDMSPRAAAPSAGPDETVAGARVAAALACGVQPESARAASAAPPARPARALPVRLLLPPATEAARPPGGASDRHRPAARSQQVRVEQPVDAGLLLPAQATPARGPLSFENSYCKCGVSSPMLVVLKEGHQ